MGRPMEFDEECAEMKSSKEIQPRVGMQVNFVGADIAITTVLRPDGVLDGFEGVVLANSYDAAAPNAPGCRWYGGIHAWNEGKYRVTWTPPTDDERRLFMEAAVNFHPDGFTHVPNVWGNHAEECYSCNNNWREIAESLALDGADYDDMPDFEELER